MSGHLLAWGVGAIGAVTVWLGGRLVVVFFWPGVTRRWPRFARWCAGRGTRYAVPSAGFLLFAAFTVYFALLAGGAVEKVEPHPSGLMVAMIPGVLAIFCLIRIVRVRASVSRWRGYRRSSDGSWSVD